MFYNSIRHVSRFAVWLTLGIVLAVPASAEDSHRVNIDAEDVAIKGYDAVAYFTEGHATKGSDEFEHHWQDARWLFSTKSHLDLFAEDPDRYAPRYGGFCSMGMAFGRYADIDPEAWVIVDEKLHLNFDHATLNRFRRNPAAYIAIADDHWENANSEEQ